jgi:ubiquinone biosynthesis protein COQ9
MLRSARTNRFNLNQLKGSFLGTERAIRIQRNIRFLSSSLQQVRLNNLPSLHISCNTSWVRSIHSSPNVFNNSDSDPLNIKKSILEKAVEFIPEDGFTSEALSRAAVSIGYSAITAGMFENGGYALIDHVMQKASLHMSDEMEKLDLQSVSVNDRIIQGVMFRIHFISQFYPKWSQAMAIGALPQNLPYTIKSLAIMADELWWLAGDRSTDINWYSRRALLIGIYTATETFSLTDTSKDFAETKEFLIRRVNEIASIGQATGNLLDVSTASFIGVKNVVEAVGQIFAPMVKDSKVSNTLIPIVSNVLQQTSNFVSTSPLFARASAAFPSNIMQSVSNTNSYDGASATNSGENKESLSKAAGL